MKVLSLWQPYATAISLGLKTIETRSFSVNYRGPLAIHATKRSPSLAEALRDPVIRAALLFPARPLVVNFPAGALLCVVELANCLPTTNTRSVFCCYPNRDTPLERAFGNYEPGRYGWVLDKIQPLPTPIPYSGHQGLRDLDPAVVKRVLAALKGKA